MVNHPRRSRTTGLAPLVDLTTEPATETIHNDTMRRFVDLKTAVAGQFRAMSKYELFRTNVEKDELWDTYLSSFPAGGNPVFRKRTEHDCSCCRQFIRAVGNVVVIVDGAVVSLWDAPMANPVYAAVSSAMSTLVKSRPIENRFLHTEGTAGTDRNFENTLGGVKTWDHFFVHIPNSLVCKGVDIGPRLSESRALHDVLLRSLTELHMGAIDTVLDLIAQNSIYRGSEHNYALTEFRKLKATFPVPSADQDNFVWSKIGELPGSVSKIRNTSIGTLLNDLSEGMDLDDAVRKFEKMVAPENYKRPTALVTPAMIAKAKATVEELGLTSSLERRYATLADVTVNNVLFADRNARKVMSGNVFDDLTSTAAIKPRAFDKIEEIGIEKFLSDVVPRATSIEVLVENRHASNLVSMIAPVDPTAPPLFKWPNGFSWTYNGDVADSIKERVKKAGGNVTGELCCRLSWSNTDDLDFHLREPTGEEIYYRHKSSRGGGCLDVDMNVGGETREPVENIFYSTVNRMVEGTYILYVNQFRKRETKDVGFEVEIDFKGEVRRFAYPKALRSGENVRVAEFTYTRAAGMTILNSLPSTAVSKKVWGVDTEAFHKVNVAMLSPNHWDGHGVGNRHYFFMLDGCQNDGSARGFYNEFLRADLDQHRKVLELVGSKMRTDESVNQLSGLGFSDTRRDHIVARVKGASARTVRVAF